MIDIKVLKKKEKPIYGYIGARVSDDLKAQLEAYCKSQSLSVSTVIVALIKEFLKDKKTDL